MVETYAVASPGLVTGHEISEAAWQTPGTVSLALPAVAGTYIGQLWHRVGNAGAPPDSVYAYCLDSYRRFEVEVKIRDFDSRETQMRSAWATSGIRQLISDDELQAVEATWGV